MPGRSRPVSHPPPSTRSSRCRRRISRTCPHRSTAQRADRRVLLQGVVLRSSSNPRRKKPMKRFSALIAVLLALGLLLAACGSDDDPSVEGGADMTEPMDDEGMMDDGDMGDGHDESSDVADDARRIERSEEHTSELQSLMRISYAVFCLKKKN